MEASERRCRHPLDPLVDVMATLRGEGGCPWDREQDHKSLRRFLVEEAYEVIEAIDQEDDAALVEELGDLLLQVVFHSQIASETGRFDIDDVVRGITAKMIRRHPHVFAGEHAPDAETVLRNWDRIKQEEKGSKEAAGPGAPSLLDGIPKGLPALHYAYEVQKRAAKVGFDWDDPRGALEKVAEESREIARSAAAHDPEKVKEEWGDLFFAMVNAARHMGVQPEEALRDAVRKFSERFRYIEAAAQRAGRSLESMSLAEMDALWEEAKEALTARAASPGNRPPSPPA